MGIMGLQDFEEGVFKYPATISGCFCDFISFSFHFIYSHSIDHTDVEFVIKYKYKQLLTIYKYKFTLCHRN
jgi:hypothetical protein